VGSVLYLLCDRDQGHLGLHEQVEREIDYRVMSAPPIYPAVGIAIAICGNILISVALNVQRYAHTRIAKRSRRNASQESGLYDYDHDRSYINDGLWWAGIIIMTAGETGNFLAYGMAPPSVVSPLGVFALVSNCVVAPVFFHEELKRRNIVGVIVSIIGILFVIFSVQQPDGIDNPEDPLHAILGAIHQLAFRVYAVITLTAIAGLLVMSSLQEAVRNAASLSSDSVNELDGNAASLSTLFYNISLAALLGAYTALSTKGLSSLLSFQFSKAVTLPITYILALVLIVTAVLQVFFLNRALKHFSATLVIPVHFVFFTISVIVGAQIAFHDFDGHDPWHTMMFFIGCLLTFLGVWLIASSGTQQTVSAEPDEEEEEEGVVEPDESALLLPNRPSPQSFRLQLPTPVDGGEPRMLSTSAHEGVSFHLTAPGLFIGTVLQKRSSAGLRTEAAENED
jgi:drug/metabolite transporter (DMT)-like permease